MPYPERNMDSRPDLFLVGDMHLGRKPVRLDEVLADLNLKPEDLSPAEALKRVVTAALHDRPRAVVFAGDLVDRDKDRWEAYPVLRHEIERLIAKNISVFAVAGNHDSFVLPKLVKDIPTIRLIGEGGKWETVPVPGDGPDIDLIAWSFARPHFRGNPLANAKESFEEALDQKRPTARLVGLLHCDLDGPSDSRYAPTPRTELINSGSEAWFLGHVHKPGDLSGDLPIGYLGSLVGLDPGETGQRGYWELRSEDAGLAIIHREIGPIRWEQLDLDISDFNETSVSIEDLKQGVYDRMRPIMDSSSESCAAALKLIVTRVRLIGESPTPRIFDEFEGAEPTKYEGEDVPIVIDRFENASRPKVDLETLKELPTPLGAVARQIISLRDHDEDSTLNNLEMIVTGVEGHGWRVDRDQFPRRSTKKLLELALWDVLQTMLELQSKVDK
jgi:DNA repair protein SbcD/Mre11